MGTPRMALVAALMAFGGTAAQAAPPLAQRIGHTDPDGMRVANGVHGGAGSMKFGPLLGAAALSTNLIFVHRGTTAPKSGIGQHFHNDCGEEFVSIDREAELTIHGQSEKTAERKGGG